MMVDVEAGEEVEVSVVMGTIKAGGIKGSEEVGSDREVLDATGKVEDTWAVS